MARRFQWLVISSVLLMTVLGAVSCGSSNATKIAVQVSPLCVALAPGGTQQFQANIFVDDVDQGVNNAAVDWTVLGGDVNGIISNDSGSQGLYTAPNTNPPPAAQVTIIATSTEKNQGNKQGQATVVLSGACPVVPPPTETF